MAEKQTIASKHDQLIEQYQATKADLQKMNWQHDNLKQQLHTTQSECQTLTQTTTQDKKFIAEVNITLAKQQQQIEQYKNMLNISEEKIANLVHKNLFLTQEKSELAAQIKFGQHSD